MNPVWTAPALEIAVTSASGAQAAQRGGADRLELCNALELGGITPSAGLVEEVLTATSLPVHILVRPRPGDFCYDQDQLATAAREARLLARQGVAGIVLGALTRDARIDSAAAIRIIEAAKSENPDLDITFHKAFDQLADPLAALPELAGLGIDRVLSSGKAQRALDGCAVLAAMTSLASGVQVMAGGGVLPGDIPALATQSQVDAVHFSAKRSGTSTPASSISGTSISLGSADGADPNAYFVTDQALVEQARSQINLLRKPG